MVRYVLVSRVRTPRREYAVSARTNDSYAFNVERIFLGSCIYRASPQFCSINAACLEISRTQRPSLKSLFLYRSCERRRRSPKNRVSIRVLVLVSNIRALLGRPQRYRDKEREEKSEQRKRRDINRTSRIVRVRSFRLVISFLRRDTNMISFLTFGRTGEHFYRPRDGVSFICC